MSEETNDLPTAAPVTLEVPAEHADIMQRALSLLNRGEQWVTDNIHAGIKHFEDIFGIKAEDAAAQQATEQAADES